MNNGHQRMHILEMIESGQVGFDEGLRLLKDRTSDKASPSEESAPTTIVSPAADDPAVEGHVLERETTNTEAGEWYKTSDLHQEDKVPQKGAPSHPFPTEVHGFRRLWIIPLWLGVGLTTLGGMLMLWAQQVSGFGFWFLLASIPFALGVMLVCLARGNRSSPVIHLSVHRKPEERPQRLVISFTIPLNPIIWFLRKFGHWIPKLEEASMDEVVEAIEQAASTENPVYIQVDEGNRGERVEIYIG